MGNDGQCAIWRISYLKLETNTHRKLWIAYNDVAFNWNMTHVQTVLQPILVDRDSIFEDLCRIPILYNQKEMSEINVEIVDILKSLINDALLQLWLRLVWCKH